MENFPSPLKRVTFALSETIPKTNARVCFLFFVLAKKIGKIHARAHHESSHATCEHFLHTCTYHKGSKKRKKNINPLIINIAMPGNCWRILTGCVNWIRQVRYHISHRLYGASRNPVQLERLLRTSRITFYSSSI